MNDNEMPGHPGNDTMASFVEGTLPPAEVAAVARHLRNCADCRTVVSETARFSRDEKPASGRGRRVWWMSGIAAAAVLAAIAILLPMTRSGFLARDPRAPLIAASPADHRIIESRLSEFPWARLQAPARGGAPIHPADLKLSGAAGEVLERTAGKTSAADLHAAGLAHLLTARYAEAIATLERSAQAAENAAVRNDLAAARYALAVAGDRPSQLPLALADANRALALDPRSPDARFNRALILEKMEMPDLARDAWEAYLALDGASAWSAEARQRLRALRSVGAAPFDPAMLTTASTNGSSLEQYVRRFPQETRTWAEGPLLAEWADAVWTNDDQRAASTLTAARGIADALARVNGEKLLGDVVTLVGRARGSEMASLSEGYRLYRDARIDYSKRRNVDAERKLRRAAAIFRAAGSPMADVASYFAACTAWDQSRNDEARAELRELGARVDERRHRALAAQIQWQLAVDANSIGDWGAATRYADAAAATFESLGETANAAFLHGVAAISLEVIGERDLAWRRRLRALRGLAAEAQRPRRGAIVHAAAMTLAAVDRTSAAQSVIELMIDGARDADPAQLSSGLTTKARIAAEHGDVATARRSVDDARAAASRVDDAGLRAMLFAQIDLVSAAADPATSAAALDRALKFFADGRLSWFRADAFLQRARVHRSMGDAHAALSDYDAAMKELETQRKTIRDAAQRLTFLDRAAKIVEETIELQLSRGAVEEAFLAADRAHALFDDAADDAAPPGGVTHMPARTALIEYAMLSDALVIFVNVDDRLTAQRIDIDRTELIERVASFTDSIRRRAPIDEIEASSQSLYRLLIAPIRSRLEGAQELVIVPDRQLYAVPFAALHDPATARYLVESITITIAPSAARSQNANDDREVFALAPAVVLADPPTPRWPRLPATRAEAQRIAALHGGTLIAGDDATRERFIAEARGSALIHYAGHANSDATESYGALLLADTERESGVLFSSEIARLSLPRRPLVILAACGTFRGETAHVAGAATLARAFLLAGARAVIGTLWEIDDDVAAVLFLRLHEHLRTGASPARALRAAQVDMLRSSDPRLRHPATWPVEILSNL